MHRELVGQFDRLEPVVVGTIEGHTGSWRTLRCRFDRCKGREWKLGPGWEVASFKVTSPVSIRLSQAHREGQFRCATFIDLRVQHDPASLDGTRWNAAHGAAQWAWTDFELRCYAASVGFTHMALAPSGCKAAEQRLKAPLMLERHTPWYGTTREFLLLASLCQRETSTRLQASIWLRVSDRMHERPTR